MKIPKYVMKLMDKKCYFAEKLNEASHQLDEWLVKNGADFTDDELNNAISTGCYIYCEPSTAKRTVIDYIENKM